MAITATDDKNIQKFKRLFAEFEQHLNGQKANPMHVLRRSAFERLVGTAFPTRKHEDWKYTSVAKLLQPEYRRAQPTAIKRSDLTSFQIPKLDAWQLVFVNGHYQADLSQLEGLTAGLTVISVNEALQDEKFGPLLQDQLKRTIEQTDHPFFLLNTVFADGGIFIHADKNAVAEKPFHLLYLTDAEEQPQMASPRRVVIAEQNSKVTLIETYVSMEKYGSEYFNNSAAQIFIRPNAEVRHYKIQEESRTAYQINVSEVFQDRDSRYSNYTVDLGGQLVRNNIYVHLQDQNIESNLYGVYLPKGKQHIDNQTSIDHAFPHCNSNELYKGVITDKGRGVFNGKVYVRQDAQKTNAFQQNSSLVLSETAIMDTKPQLEIFADDVKCSHGATVGQLDENAVFYLRSRGLTDYEARQTLQYAFLLEVIETIPHEALQAYVEALVRDKFAETLDS